MPVLPAEIPMMILSECNLCPHALLPLFIFEPRYRLMLAEVLGSHRVFGIAMRRPDAREPDEPGGEESVFTVATAGLVRACVSNPDGTSHLVLQGVRRVRIDHWIRMLPYPVASVRPFETIPGDEEACGRLAEQLVATAERLARCGDGNHAASLPFRQHLAAASDPEAVVDLVTHTFVLDPFARQAILGMACTEARLRETLRLLGDNAEDVGDEES